MLATFDTSRLGAAPEALGEALEANRIVYFPACPIDLPDESTLEFLRTELPSRLKLKNVSYHPEADRLTGLEADSETTARVKTILKAHLADVTGFLRQFVGHLTAGLRIGTCSFRPIQERGRNLSPHASNELVHIDAGAYGATGGDRILRFFVNVNSSEDRVWATKGNFDDILRRCGREAGLLDEAGALQVKISKGVLDFAFSGLVAGLGKLNPLALVLDSSPYDRAMRRLHNYMKDDAAFKVDQRGYEEIRFPPRSAWMVFTDGVSHASLSGQFALVTTMIVRRESQKRPEQAPYNRLAALA
jgi:hypothetical protein